MAFLDKINDFAKTATEKTNNAIETAKLSAKIDSEQRSLNDIIRKIGEHYVAKIDAGEVLDEEVMAIYEGVLASRKTIAELRAEIESLKTPKNPEGGSAEDSSSKFCPYCGKELDVSAKFCLNCGKQQP
ncbi:MAG: zinc ribbon domain-containing protein [Oscillospiraceae bacterium]|nr:zinc ribbon domain-containing protein [Oscillospiraceae bacterium]MBQ4643268.1 zinc ribbon domain-containing protein [Oscillospiraceae bacterium]